MTRYGQIAHGFVWPDGLPSCVYCQQGANSPIHVTPGQEPSLAADKATPRMPQRAHAYMMSSPTLTANISCQACGQTMRSGPHGAGMPSGAMLRVEAKARSDKPTLPGEGDRYPIENVSDLKNAIQAFGRGKPEDKDKIKRWIMRRARELNAANLIPDGWTQKAFVAEIGHRLVFAAPVTTDVSAGSLPREVAAEWQQASEANPNWTWIAGRYVEADRPNRNAAYWSTEDLELGEPTVQHGPINWLHEERHIIGSIAASKMVRPERQAADANAIGNHIVVLGALWPHVYPQEVGAIQKASEAGKLWVSMECVSKEVACLSCDNTLSYRDYMEKASRCEHMNDGMPRRFKDPVFGGAGIIVPPVRPGWANADVRVLMPQAAELAERQAASFTGMSTTEAELLVAEILVQADADAG